MSLRAIVSSAHACLLFAALAGCTGTISSQRASVRSGKHPDAGSAHAPIEVDNANHTVSMLADDAGPADASTMEQDAGKSGCGNGKIEPGEACDDGNSDPGDGCSADCTQVERDFVCDAPGRACVSTVVCGDGRLSGHEACDDGNARDGDGCDHGCQIEAGWVCPTPGARCQAAACGDGIVAGDEQCDDDNKPPMDGDGCSAQCKLEPGYVCDSAGKPCRATVCNDGVKEGSEACDDGNQVLGDGCTPFCEVEPDCSAGACKSRCGDGLILPSDNEACDDGNKQNGDGCSSDCQIEPGYTCSIEADAPPDQLKIPATFRDFISFSANGSSTHPDFQVFAGNGVTPGLVANMLSMDDKPVYTGICDDRGKPYPSDNPLMPPCPYNQQTTTQANFDQWYRDTPGVNVSKVAQLTLSRDAQTGLYQLTNDGFFPWDGDTHSLVSQALEQANNGHDFGFTSEVHYYFTYDASAMPAQVLTFSGDDDVWVFVNRQLAVDLGGVHWQQNGSVTLDADTAKRLGLESGKLYEISLFHAERHTDQSNFNLTLGGFIHKKSQCSPKCGDGIVAGDETCDDGKNDSSYGSCTSDCRRAAHCGDGIVQKDHEQCDDGVNLGVYGANGKPVCAPGCMWSSYCGDGHIDSVEGEQCDDGTNAGGYGQCGPGCRLGPRCGDKIVQSDAGEQCDDGNRVSGDGCSSACQKERPI